MLIALIILYLIGWIGCYYACRAVIWERRNAKTWNILEKLVIILVSTLSWVSIFILLTCMVLFINDIVDPDKEIKW